MIAVRPLSRMAYAERKVRRFADDIASATVDPEPYWDDVVRDALRLGSDILTLADDVVEQGCDPADDFRAVHQLDRLMAEWEDALAALSRASAGADLDRLGDHRRAVAEWRTDPATLRVFRRLADAWTDGTKFLSSSGQIDAHPSYRQVIRMGPAVVPFILADLKRTSRHWFTALQQLTGENPVPRESWGRIRDMADHWLAWGRARGLVV